jgi:hypothetical protein
MKIHSSHSPAIAPRLLSLKQAAEYLGCSYWTARDYVLAGLVPVVNLPPLRPREGDRAKTSLRRVLVDREDLDRFIEALKYPGARALSASAPSIQAQKSGG